MQFRQENHRRSKYIDLESYTRKYTYLNDENVIEPKIKDRVVQTDLKERILETISEQAISEEKGSISNRSQLITQQQRIQNNLSERYINQNNNKDWLPLNQIPIKSARSSQNTPENTNHIKNTGFQKKTHPLSTHLQISKSFSQNQEKQSNIPILSPMNYKLGCQQCSYYSYKIAELQNSYELLLSAKNQQLDECKIIIEGLQQKLIIIEKRTQHQLEKNKKIKAQFQKRNFDQIHSRLKQNQMMDYLKNREIILMEQIKELQNQIFITKIRPTHPKIIKSQKYLSKKSSSQSNPINMDNNNPVYLNMQLHDQDKLKASNLQHSVSEYSANTQKSQINQTTQRQNRSYIEKGFEQSPFNTLPKLSKNQLVKKVPLTQILIKNNQIESLKDDLLVSQLKTKLQQTKNLQNLYQIR